MSFGRLVKVTETQKDGPSETIYVVALQNRAEAIKIVAAKHPKNAKIEDIGPASEQLVKVLGVPPGE